MGMGSGVAWARGISPDNANRHPADFYPTPPEGILPLLEVEKFDGSIWEPACGDGAISKELISVGYEVISSDLFDYGFGETGIDFLEQTVGRAPNIVTNPPFKCIEPFLENALKLTTGKVAILARLALLEGKRRQQIFKSSPLSKVWVFSKRVTMCRGGEKGRSKQGGMVAFAWFVFDHSYKGEPRIGWL